MYADDTAELLAFLQGLIYGKFEWELVIADDEPGSWEMWVSLDFGLEFWFIMGGDGVLAVELRAAPTDISTASSHEQLYPLLATANQVHEAMVRHLRSRDE